MTPNLTCPAPAKLNLFLHAAQGDGYHLLQTLFRFIDLHDTCISPCATMARGAARPCYEVAEDQDAARLLQSETKCALGGYRGGKHIPLGGGSAAAARRGNYADRLNRLWSLGLSRALMRLGLQLARTCRCSCSARMLFAEGVAKRCRPACCRKRGMWCCFPVQVPTAEISRTRITRNTVSSQCAPF
jgi:4-diphosphocytidyl-2-C-methyl-D-erythritol kinase